MWKMRNENSNRERASTVGRWICRCRAFGHPVVTVHGGFCHHHWLIGPIEIDNMPCLTNVDCVKCLIPRIFPRSSDDENALALHEVEMDGFGVLLILIKSPFWIWKASHPVPFIVGETSLCPVPVAVEQLASLRGELNKRAYLACSSVLCGFIISGWLLRSSWNSSSCWTFSGNKCTHAWLAVVSTKWFPRAWYKDIWPEISASFWCAFTFKTCFSGVMHRKILCRMSKSSCSASSSRWTALRQSWICRMAVALSVWTWNLEKFSKRNTVILVSPNKHIIVQ